MKEIYFPDTTTNSPAETRRLGIALGRKLTQGGVVGLCGGIGAGKTVLAVGIFRGAGVEPSVAVTSPTFTLVNIYPGPREMIHVDLYRLKSAREAVDAGLTELWEWVGEAGEGGDAGERGAAPLVVVEWFEKFPEIWPPRFLRIDMDVTGKRERRLRFSFHSGGKGPLP